MTKGRTVTKGFRRVCVRDTIVLLKVMGGICYEEDCTGLCITQAK